MKYYLKWRVYMKSIILVSFLFLICSSGLTQSNTASVGNSKILKSDDSPLSVTAIGNGKYSFSYQNEMSGKTDIRTIVFRNKQEARSFLGKIGIAISSKDGVSCMFMYTNYRIRLLTEMGGVFMIVNEKGLTQSTIRISKESYSQVNTL
jgi:hypothetical protein